ncbi:hypothetical protein ACFWZ4_16310 [Frateuria sp. GZRe12]|uniref:hypothetical protein n=1 Tax=Frateuria sp. GZRe12 TaxID=3351533 RepID=UPI003EDBB576
MKAVSRNRALAALACLFTTALAAQPLVAAAQSSPGTVLLTRHKSGMINGSKWPISSAIFSIRDDGTGQRQLTPWKPGIFNLPSPTPRPINAFSPSGRYSLYLKQYSDLAYPNPTIRGKYFLMNAQGERIKALFPGNDDLQPPSEGPSYGSVTWGPAGTNEIAYANSADDQPHKHPACIRLMHPDGSADHKLWCAPRWNYRAIEGIRWSGDGRSMLAYAVLSDGTHHFAADLFLIDTATGTATLVQKYVEAPYNQGGVGDLSYDGHKVLYPVLANTDAPGPCAAATNPETPVVWCVKNMLTGQVSPLVDPTNVTREWLNHAAISPDGSLAILMGGNISDFELYAFNADGTGMHKITSACVDNYRVGSEMFWNPVRFSPDSKLLLANCDFDAFQYPPPPGTGTHKVYVIDPVTGNARFVSYGDAYDWHVPSM